MRRKMTLGTGTWALSSKTVIKVMALIVILLALCQSKTSITYTNFTNEFSMEMYAHYEQNITMTYTLLRFKKPMPVWHENFWLGIGYNTDTMDSADLVICKYHNDKASC